MSYEAWGEPDDDYMSVDAAINDGWLAPEEAAELLKDVQHMNRLVLGLFIALLAVTAASFT